MKEWLVSYVHGMYMRIATVKAENRYIARDKFKYKHPNDYVVSVKLKQKSH